MLRTTEKPSMQEVNLDALTQAYDPDNFDLTISTKPHFLYHGTIPKPTLILSGKGATLETDKGPIIDFSAQVVNCVLGQNDPWVKAHQIAYLSSDRPSYTSISCGGHEIYYSLPQRLAKLKIGNIIDPVINFRQCNGSDAVELAVLAAYAYDAKQTEAKKREKRPLLISFKGSYHGQSLMAYLISDAQNDNVFLVPKPDNVKFLDTPPHAKNIDAEVLTSEESKILEQVEKLSHEAFAVLIEPIQMNQTAGHTFSKAFLKGLNEICRKNDVCFILDEIQTGMGWLGSLTISEQLNLQPDIVALGKGLTAGYGPLALIVAEKKYNYLPDRTTGKTQGADIRSMIAVHAVLDRLLGLPEEKVAPFASGKLQDELRTGLLCQAKLISNELDRHLQILKALFPNNIGEIRGGGVIKVIPILDEKTKSPDTKLANAIHLAGTKHGIFIRNNGGDLIIKTPLTITSAELELGFKNLIAAMKSCFEPKHEFKSTEIPKTKTTSEVNPENSTTKEKEDIFERFVRQKMKISTQQLKKMGTFKESSMPRQGKNKTYSYDDMSIVRATK